MSTLPEVKDDPLLEQGRQAHIDYDRKVAEIRADARLSDLAKAEQIDAAWTSFGQTVQAAQAKFYEQRQSRLQELEALVPIGPNISADVPRADAAVLHQSFSVAFASAQDASVQDLTQRYAQAVRFGDDMTARAVITAASDRGLRDVLNLWAAEDPTRGAALKEAARLRELLTGTGTGVDSRWAAQAFGHLMPRTQPRESQDLKLIRQRAGV